MTARIAVAASGGRDSTALLHATVRAARSLGVQVWAFHVHHGLSAQADGWAAHVRGQCRRWSTAESPVGFDMVRLSGAPAPGESVEAWARRGRYEALGALARQHGVEAVLLAQHRRDQAETVLLQVLRGGGPAGAAAMPAKAERRGIAWLRPWLERSDAEIDAYVRRWRLSHVEDDSNADERYARNRLRRRVWPTLLEAFPQAEAAVGASAVRMAEAAACLRELAQLDLSACLTSGGGRPEEFALSGRMLEDVPRTGSTVALDARALSRLSRDRRANLLRHWLAEVQAAPVPDSLVRRLTDEAVTPRGGRRWPAPLGEVRLERCVLRYRG